MLSELGDELDSFIERYVDSFIKWDLIVFFHENPGRPDTLDNLAARLGRKPEDVEVALEELVRDQFVTMRRVADTRTYQFEPTAELRHRVDLFAEALRNRDKRLRILTKLLRMGAR